MVAQKVLDLHQPLDETAEPSIRRAPLEPEWATAALTLHGDYYRQGQSNSNSLILWHPLTQLYILTLLGGFTVYEYSELWEISDTVGEFWHLVLNNKFMLTSYFPILIFLAGTIGLISIMITDEFRHVSDLLAQEEYMAKLFGFPLRIYAASTAQDLKTKQTKDFIEAASYSTEFIEYRNTPVAVVTVVPLPDRSDSETFYAKITGLHVRKVYRNTGLQAELLDIAVEKSKELANRYLKENKLGNNIKIILIGECYSFDRAMPALFKKNNFKLVESSSNVNPFSTERNTDKFLNLIPASALMSFFAISRQIYELPVEGSIEILTEKAEKSARRRKN